MFVQTLNLVDNGMTRGKIKNLQPPSRFQQTCHLSGKLFFFGKKEHAARVHLDPVKRGGWKRVQGNATK